MNELNSKEFNMFESTTTHFMKKHENFRNLKRIQEKFEQTKRSILFRHEQNETNRQQVDQSKEAKCLSLNINDMKVKMSKSKMFKRLNLRNVYYSIRLTTKKTNMITFCKKDENSINKRKSILIKNVQLMTKTSKQQLLSY